MPKQFTAMPIHASGKSFQNKLSYKPVGADDPVRPKAGLPATFQVLRSMQVPWADRSPLQQLSVYSVFKDSK